jgi:predicted ester cyclase/heme-degrading monooxygenase HmoA
MATAQTMNTIKKNTQNQEAVMSTIQRNKDVIRNVYEQALNKRNMDLLPELVSEDYVGIGGEKGVAGFKSPILALITAFPDIQWKLEELIGEDDKVVVKWKVQGTHTAQFQHIAATGKIVSNNAIAIYELKNGKVVNVQVLTDRLGFLQQLDVLPPDVALLVNKKASPDQVSFIDKFFVPAPAKKEFYERMHINRNFIKKLPGFIEDAVYEYTDDKGNLICITVAKWESKKAVETAKEAVQAEYKKQGFNPAEMFERLAITMDRALYSETESSN